MFDCTRRNLDVNIFGADDNQQAQDNGKTLNRLKEHFQINIDILLLDDCYLSFLLARVELQQSKFEVKWPTDVNILLFIRKFDFGCLKMN